MTEEQRRKIIRVVALRLLSMEISGAPATAIGPPSQWWTTAEEVVDLVAPYFREVYRREDV